jgi:hypothetical protein
LAADSAAASWARSWLVSSSVSRSPRRTLAPDSKWIFSTIPGRSALTVTPCTATTEATDRRVSGHSCSSATTVVTASGGGWNDAPCAMAALIWKNFVAPRPTISTIIVPVTISMRFFMAFSCENPVGCRFLQRVCGAQVGLLQAGSREAANRSTDSREIATSARCSHELSSQPASIHSATAEVRSCQNRRRNCSSVTRRPTMRSTFP